MGEMTLPGVVVVDLIELRFAYSGKLARVLKRTGDLVKKGELVAVLDRFMPQAELDRELADYEEVRAEWEIFNLKKKGATDDETRYLRTVQQARLNTSVKAVELAKAKVDLCELRSVVSGIIVNDGGNREGLNVTPSANSFTVIDYDSFRFRLELTYDKMNIFAIPRDVVVKIPGVEKEFAGKTTLPLLRIKNEFVVDINLLGISGVFEGQPGEAKVSF